MKLEANLLVLNKYFLAFLQGDLYTILPGFIRNSRINGTTGRA